jgi:Site-specific recombinase XerD
VKGHFYRKYCTCPKNRKCTCGAKWYFAIDIGIDPKTGKRKQKRKGGFATRKEAELAAAKLIQELSEGTYVTESNITFRAFADQWLELYENSGKVKISTIIIRKKELKRLLDFFAKMKLRDITLKHYQDALIELKRLEYAEQTIKGIHTTARMIFKKAVELGKIKKDPTEFAVIPKDKPTVEDIESKKEIPKYLERDELIRFLDTARTYGSQLEYTIFLTLAYTGLRGGELLALKWSDIDLDEQTISITKTLFNPSGGGNEYTLLTPKTASSIRTIDIDSTVIAELRKLRAVQNEVRMKYRDRYRDQNFVFANLTKHKWLGHPLNTRSLPRQMKRYLRLAGLDESLTPHSLRHTHTSLLAEAGATLEEIMERLGHHDSKTTRNVYLHITKKRKKAVAQMFADLMSNR